MTSSELMQRGKRVYEERFKSDLERTHPHYFVAIEPESATYYLGRTLSEAANAAHQAYPDRRACIFRVGHEVALHIGVVDK